MTPALVLDSEALWILADTASAAQRDLASLVARVRTRGGRVFVPALVCAEVCREGARTRAVESLLSRQSVGGVTGIKVVGTDFEFAKQVGLLLGNAGRGSESLADAHVVTLAVNSGGAVVATSDPDDIRALAEHRPGVRVVVHRC